MLRSGPSLWRDREPCTPTRHDERLWPLHIIYLDGHAVHGSVDAQQNTRRSVERRDVGRRLLCFQLWYGSYITICRVASLAQPHAARDQLQHINSYAISKCKTARSKGALRTQLPSHRLPTDVKYTIPIAGGAPAGRARSPWDTDAVDRAVRRPSRCFVSHDDENRSDKVESLNERTWKLIKVITDHPFEELIEPCGEMFVSHEANGSIELRAGNGARGTHHGFHERCHALECALGLLELASPDHYLTS